MKHGKKIALTAGLVLFGSLFIGPIAVGAAGALMSGGNSCTAATEVSFKGSDSLTGMSAEFYLNQFSKKEQTSKIQIVTKIYQAGEARPHKESAKAIAIAVAVGIQESNLTNLETKATDGSDSLGVFQQRPSQGWGTREDILDVTKSANKFYDHLDRIADIDKKSMIKVALEVQNPNIRAYTSRWNWDKTASQLLEQVGAPGASSSCQTTGWELPLASGSYTISSVFGTRFDPYFHRSQLHDGTDLAAPKNTPVHAVHAGKVLIAGVHGSYGNYVGLDNGNGVETGYGHLTSVASGLEVGDTVSVGQVVGYVGSTGASTGNHLHFLVHLNGRPTDPVAFMNSNNISLKDGQ